MPWCGEDTKKINPSHTQSFHSTVKWSSSHTLVCLFLWRTEDPCDSNVIDVWMGQPDWSKLMHLSVFTLKVGKYVDDGLLPASSALVHPGVNHPTVTVNKKDTDK